MTTDQIKKTDTSCRGFFIDTRHLDFNGGELQFIEKNIHNYYPLKMREHVSVVREVMKSISSLPNVRHTFQAQLRTKDAPEQQRRFNGRQQETPPPRYVVRESLRGTFKVEENIYTLEVGTVPLDKQDGFRVRNETSDSAEIPSSKTKEEFERALDMLCADREAKEKLQPVIDSLYGLLFMSTKTTRTKIHTSLEEKTISVVLQHTESSSHVISFKLKIAPRKYEQQDN